MQRNRLQGVPVAVDGTLLGIVAASDLMRAGGPSDQVTAADIMTPNPATVTLRTPVSEALERMAALGVGRLPVVEESDATRLIAMFRREDVVTAYHQALGATARARTHIDQLRARTDSNARFFELAIAAGSLADGRPISEIPWPEGCVVVSVHRGSRLLVPNGSTVIRAGDAITAFGSDEALHRLVERLAPPDPAPPDNEQ
jgi:K+/H+ antiporter YhaU regulatory subunit KhtT